MIKVSLTKFLLKCLINYLKLIFVFNRTYFSNNELYIFTILFVMQANITNFNNKVLK